VPGGSVTPGRILFPLDQAHGWWLPGYSTVFSTTDAGRTWARYLVG
jgi:photosystem II stability/assembly factor-like uncharacterized protein